MWFISCTKILLKNQDAKNLNGGVVVWVILKNAGERLRQEEESNDSSSIFEKMGSQTPINVIFKRSERGDACQEIALFFYNNGIPFNVAKSVEFKRILELVAKHGVRFKPLTYHEIRVKYLKQQVEKTN